MSQILRLRLVLLHCDSLELAEHIFARESIVLTWPDGRWFDLVNRFVNILWLTFSKG